MVSQFNELLIHIRKNSMSSIIWVIVSLFFLFPGMLQYKILIVFGISCTIWIVGVKYFNSWLSRYSHTQLRQILKISGRLRILFSVIAVITMIYTLYRFHWSYIYLIMILVSGPFWIYTMFQEINSQQMNDFLNSR